MRVCQHEGCGLHPMEGSDYCGRHQPRPAPAAETWPQASRWGCLTDDGWRVRIALDDDSGRWVLSLGAEHAMPSAEVYLTPDNLRALAAAAAIMSGAQAERADEIRRDERVKLAALFEDNLSTLASFPKSTRAAIEMVVLLLRLNNPAET